MHRSYGGGWNNTENYNNNQQKDRSCRGVGKWINTDLSYDKVKELLKRKVQVLFWSEIQAKDSKSSFYDTTLKCIEAKNDMLKYYRCFRGNKKLISTFHEDYKEIFNNVLDKL